MIIDTTQTKAERRVSNSERYPIYYMRAGTSEVYKLWQPGIIIGLGDSSSPAHRFAVYDVTSDGRMSRCKHLFSSNVFGAFTHAPPHSYVEAHVHAFDSAGNMLPIFIKDEFGIPYEVCDGIYLESPTYEPRIIGLNWAKSLMESGTLRPCKPFRNFGEFVFTTQKINERKQVG